MSLKLSILFKENQKAMIMVIWIRIFQTGMLMQVNSKGLIRAIGIMNEKC